MYQRSSYSGGSPELWEENWSGGGLTEAIRFCEIDPLRPVFERYAHPGVLMLEGGCGRGQYVIYCTSRGVRVVGLDFARKTLTGLRSRDSRLVLCAGDVSKLPFRDESFDVYYSGGVVEHFETGPEASLREAWRVLKPGGVLLISVPYLSPLRKALTPFRSGEWRSVSRCDGSTTGLLSDNVHTQFFQYVYTPREFGSMLYEAGFRILERQGYGVLWGLHDLSSLRQSFGRRKANRGTERNATLATPPSLKEASNSNEVEASLSLLKRLIVSEDAKVPVAGSIVRLMRWACANMMMYVCARRS